MSMYIDEALIGDGNDIAHIDFLIGRKDGPVEQAFATGILPKNKAEDLVIVCGVFIHWEAQDDKKIYQYNYEATKLAIANAMQGKPTADEMIAGKEKAVHPFRGF